MVTINTYTYNGEPNAVTKTLPPAVPITGLMYNDPDNFNMSVEFRGATPPTFNYVFIDDLQRYYFVDGYTLTKRGSVHVRLSCDVLMTFSGAIRNSIATVIERSNSNPFISSRETVYDMKPHTEKFDFPNVVFSDDNSSIIMVTLKGE